MSTDSVQTSFHTLPLRFQVLIRALAVACTGLAASVIFQARISSVLEASVFMVLFSITICMAMKAGVDMLAWAFGEVAKAAGRGLGKSVLLFRRIARFSRN